MYVRVLVTCLSGVLHPENEAIGATTPLRWLPILEELLHPWKDVRIVVASSRLQSAAASELPQLLGSLKPRLFGNTFNFLPEEDAIAASVRVVNGQLEHLVLVADRFDFSRQCLNVVRCNPLQGLSSDVTRGAVSAWLQNSSPGLCG